jgi:hypothetical protein
MAIYLMGIGEMIRQMGLAPITMSMVANMKGNGSTIFNKEMERKHGKINQHMKVNTRLDRSTEKVAMSGLTEAYIRALGLIIKYRAMVFTNGQMAESTKENGLIIKWMEEDN